MVIQTNPELMSAMRNSYVLQKKFTPHQINQLIEKAFELGQEAQSELLKICKEEKIDINMNTLIKKISPETVKMNQYQSKINTIIKNIQQKEMKKIRNK